MVDRTRLCGGGTRSASLVREITWTDADSTVPSATSAQSARSPLPSWRCSVRAARAERRVASRQSTGSSSSVWSLVNITDRRLP